MTGIYRYLRIKREKSLIAALDQLDKDRGLTFKVNILLVRRKLAGDGPAIYRIDGETAIEVHSKEIAEALDVVSATTVKDITSQGKWTHELIKNMALNSALAAFEYLGYVKYVSVEEIKIYE